MLSWHHTLVLSFRSHRNKSQIQELCGSLRHPANGKAVLRTGGEATARSKLPDFIPKNHRTARARTVVELFYKPSLCWTNVHALWRDDKQLERTRGCWCRSTITCFIALWNKDRINPRTGTPFAGEDFVGRISRIARARHRSTVSLRVLMRYLALLHLHLERLKVWKKGMKHWGREGAYNHCLFSENLSFPTMPVWEAHGSSACFEPNVPWGPLARYPFENPGDHGISRFGGWHPQLKLTFQWRLRSCGWWNSPFKTFWVK